MCMCIHIYMNYKSSSYIQICINYKPSLKLIDNLLRISKVQYILGMKVV